MENAFPVQFMDPSIIISQLGISPGIVAADFGCGSGYFTLPLAQLIGEEGVVHALDILPQALETVESKAKMMNLNNVVITRVNLEKIGGSKLPDAGVDWIILKDMLFQNQQKEVILQEIHRVLRPTGKAFVAEWEKNGSTVGPEQTLRMTKEDLNKLLQENKFKVEREVNVGNFHYAVVVSKI
jgi:ubiquinone/menaquinone biosynthesis C-methylase UbiE